MQDQHCSGPDAPYFYDMRPVAVVKMNARQIHAERTVAESGDLIFIIIDRQARFSEQPEVCAENGGKDFVIIDFGIVDTPVVSE